MREYEHIPKPSVAYLASCGCLLLDIPGLAGFLGISAKAVRQLAWTGRVPLPIRLGGTLKWNIIGLLDWVEAGCPRPTHRKAAHICTRSFDGKA